MNKKTYHVEIDLLIGVDKVVMAENHDEAIAKVKDIITREGYTVKKYTGGKTKVLKTNEEIDIILKTPNPYTGDRFYFWLGDGTDRNQSVTIDLGYSEGDL